MTQAPKAKHARDPSRLIAYKLTRHHLSAQPTCTHPRTKGKHMNVPTAATTLRPRCDNAATTLRVERPHGHGSTPMETGDSYVHIAYNLDVECKVCVVLV